MSLRKCEKLSAMMTENTAPCAIRRLWIVWASPACAGTLVLIIPSLPRFRRAGLWTGFAQILSAFPRWQPFGLPGGWGRPNLRVCGASESQNDQANGHRARQSEGRRPGGFEAVLPRRARVPDRRGGPRSWRRLHDFGREFPYARHRAASLAKRGAAPAARTNRARPH